VIGWLLLILIAQTATVALCGYWTRRTVRQAKQEVIDKLTVLERLRHHA
jgi:hypothetical protein